MKLQTKSGETHLRAYASGLLHEKLKNIKAFVRLRLAYLSAEVSAAPVLAKLQQWRSGPQLRSRDHAALGRFLLFWQSFPLTVGETLWRVRLCLWVLSGRSYAAAWHVVPLPSGKRENLRPARWCPSQPSSCSVAGWVASSVLLSRLFTDSLTKLAIPHLQYYNHRYCCRLTVARIWHQTPALRPVSLASAR